MTHLMQLLVLAASPNPAKSIASGLNPLQVLLAVLTLILLLLFIGFLLSGRRRSGDRDDADEPEEPQVPDDGLNGGERVIYHAQPRPLRSLGPVAEAAPETIAEPPAPEAPAAVEPELPPALTAPPDLPAHPLPGRPLTAWARSPAAAPVRAADGRQPAASPVAPAVKAPPFIFPSTQRAEPRVPDAPAAEQAAPETVTASVTATPAAQIAAAAVPPPTAAASTAAPAASPAVAATAYEANENKGTLILLIEDDERIAKFYSILFQAKGFRVENAHDGIEGVDMAQSLNPALILLDVMMPRMNGLMVLQVLRANPETAKTPVVVLSNYMEPPLIQRALQLGAIEYVVKSQARPEQLVNALPSWLRGEPAIH
ncbi:MAG TPA: response regulator [Candidatus Dormibacteraeota bacterium]|nr:response regulator [Candidatus Dormibacteraeota bacterium]